MSGLLLVSLSALLLGLAVPSARGAVVKSFLAALLVPMVTFVGGSFFWILLQWAGWADAGNLKGWLWCCAGLGLPMATAASAWAAWPESGQD